MAEQPSRTPRQVGIADHLWDTFAQMSQDMGVDREGLVNQALFAFARQNGYVNPARPPAAAEEPRPAPLPVAVAVPPPPVFVAPAPVFVAPPPPVFVAPPPPVFAPPPVFVAPAFVAPPAPVASLVGAQPFGAPPPGSRLSMDEATPPSGVPALVPASPATVPQVPGRFEPAGSAYDDEPPPGATAAIRAPRFAPLAAPPPVVAAPPPPTFGPPPVLPAPPPAVPAPAPFAPPSTSPDLGTKMSPDEVRAAQERVLQKAAELERLVRGGGGDDAEGVDDGLLGHPDEGTPSPVQAKSSDSLLLVLYAEGREVDRVVGPRFLIGRGKHCDLIINSGKVSREHAAIVKDGDQYFIEDLGSSNGTWFDKKRITRRKVEDGDEYFVCSEKLTCRFE